MKNSFFVSILSAQIVDGQPCTSKITAPCRVDFKRNFGTIFYKEYSENREFLSIIKIFDSNNVTITRKSLQTNQLIFEENKRNLCQYYTEFGSISLGVFTHEIICNFEKNSCSLKLIYSLDVNNALLSKNIVIISVKEENYV